MASHGQPLHEKEVTLLRLLRPAHIWAEIDLQSASWRSSLLQAFQQAKLLDALLELSVLCDDN
jgi:hypothetical protein